MGFLKSIEHSFSEVEGRKNGLDGVLSFGIKYLDDAMIGILKNDLVLIGAGSGLGKTALCCIIAKTNVEKGRRVHYIALEAEHLEIERRIKYQLFANAFFNDPSRPKVEISFQDWMLGSLFEKTTLYEAIAAKSFLEKFTTLNTFYKSDKFDVTDLINTVMECASETDLIILDHVHYMDLESDNENQAIKKIAMTARTLALEIGKPIILVSHMRKSDKGINPLAPGIEDFYGSSDLYKIATKAITVGAGGINESGKVETFFRIVKNRFEGSVTRYLGKCFYNTKEGNYDKSYEVGNANQSRDAGFTQLAFSSYPAWAEYYNGKGSDNSSYDETKSFPYGNTRGPQNISTAKANYKRQPMGRNRFQSSDE